MRISHVGEILERPVWKLYKCKGCSSLLYVNGKQQLQKKGHLSLKTFDCTRKTGCENNEAKNQMKGGFFPPRIEILEKPQISIKSKEKIEPFQEFRIPNIYFRICVKTNLNESKDLVPVLSDTKPHVAEQTWACAPHSSKVIGAVPQLQQHQRQGFTSVQELLGFWAPGFSSWAQDSTSGQVCRCSSAGTEVLLHIKMSWECKHCWHPHTKLGHSSPSVNATHTKQPPGSLGCT